MELKMTKKNKLPTIFNVFNSIFFLFFAFSVARATETKLKEKHVRVALVIAQATNARIESSFGHAFLRFSQNESFDSVEDQVVEFVADVPEGEHTKRLKGLGLAGSYPIKVSVRPWYLAAAIHSSQMERSLTHFVLKLETHQVSRLVLEIQELHRRSLENRYNFLFHNCTTVIAETLRKVAPFPKTILSANLPEKFPIFLDEQGLIAEKFELPSSREIRAEIVSKLYDKSLGNAWRDHPIAANLKRQLISADKTERVIAYAKLRWILRKKGENQESLTQFSLQLIANEIPTIRKEGYFLIRGDRDAFERYSPLLLNRGNGFIQDQIEKNPGSWKEVQSTFFDSSSGPGILLQMKSASSLSIGAPPTGMNDIVHRMKVYPAQLKREKDSSLSLNGKFVEYGGFNKKHSIILPEIANTSRGSFLLINVLQDVLPNNPLRGALEVPDPNIGQVCYGMAWIQKLLMEGAHFAPRLPKVSTEDYQALFNMIIEGSSTLVIPGAKDIVEFLSFLPETFLRDRIRQTQSRVNHYGKLVAEYFTREKVNSRSEVENIKTLTQNGIYPLVTFTPLENKNVDHALVIFGVHEVSNGYYLEAYDPNLGLVKFGNPSIWFFIGEKSWQFQSSIYPNQNGNLYWRQ